MKEINLQDGDVHFIGIYYQNELLSITIEQGDLVDIAPKIGNLIKSGKIKYFNQFNSQEQRWCYPKEIFTLSYINCDNRYILQPHEMEWITFTLIRIFQPKYIHKGKDLPYHFTSDLPIKIKFDSKFESTVGEWLNNHNILYEHNYEFEDLVGDAAPLRFDFKIKNKNIFIEAQGEQHYHYDPYWHKNKKQFEKQVEYDMKKRDYCAKHKYWLIEIPYTCKNLDRYLLPILLEQEIENLT